MQDAQPDPASVSPLAAPMTRRRVLWLARTLGWGGLITAAAGSGAYSAASNYLADQLSLSKRVPITVDPATIGKHYRRIAFRSQEGLLLRGWLFFQEGDRAEIAQRRCITLVHGLNENRINGLELLARGMLARHDLLVFDQSGAGESEGNRVSLGKTSDVLGAYDFLTANVGYDPKHLAFIGISMGGAALLNASISMPQVTIVADSAPADLRPFVESALAKDGIPWWLDIGVETSAHRDHGIDVGLRPIDAVAQQNRPFLFFCGTADETVPYLSALELLHATADLSTLQATDHYTPLTNSPDGKGATTGMLIVPDASKQRQLVQVDNAGHVVSSGYPLLVKWTLNRYLDAQIGVSTVQPRSTHSL